MVLSHGKVLFLQKAIQILLLEKNEVIVDFLLLLIKRQKNELKLVISWDSRSESPFPSTLIQKKLKYPLESNFVANMNMFQTGKGLCGL